MDKELLRIVIVAIGVAVMVAMILWSTFKNRKPKRKIDFYDKGDPLDNIDESLILSMENDEFDISTVDQSFDTEISLDTESDMSHEADQTREQGDIELPKLIQFSLVASADEGFNGNALFSAFEKVGLEYGDMRVFERIDSKRRVDFAVASMVEPGTFPDEHLESFFCPGIVFFLQPGEMEEPLLVFDDFIQTINLLETELDGVKWDHKRQPLTEETVQQFRQCLSEE